jgi:hypothetical protein
MRARDLLIVSVCLLTLSACGRGDAETGGAQDEPPAGTEEARSTSRQAPGEPPPAEVPPELKAPAPGEIPIPKSTEPPSRGTAVDSYEECMAQARQNDDAEGRKMMEEGCRLIPRAKR